MQPFAYARATGIEDAIAIGASDPDAAFVAGGTELLNWLKEGIANPRRLVDINRLPLGEIESAGGMLRIGALARMSEVAVHPVVRERLPAIAEALDLSASMQLRNMASIGGNLMQRTRCPYFRAETVLPCNKRVAGSGCSALAGSTRAAAIFGAGDACVATHPSDLAVALCALEAKIHIRSGTGERVLAIDDFYRLPGSDPSRETVLERGELIVAVEIPLTAPASRSRYLKVRERTSYEFALVSAAVAVELDGTRIRRAQVALGGVAPKPWRLATAEAALAGTELSPAAVRAALEPAFAEARPLAENAFKIELAKRTAVRALTMAGGAP